MVSLNYKSPPDHTKEYLGGDTWGTKSYFWDSNERAYYYVSQSYGEPTYTKDGWNYKKVTEPTMLSNLKKKYNRGGELYGPDYNPFLETESTIKTEFGGSGVAVNGAGGSVRFPHDMRIGKTEDFVMFDFYDYRPPFKQRTTAVGDVVNQTLKQYNASGYAGEYFKDKSYPQILMYMPQDIQDQFAAKWEGKKFGQTTTGLLAAAGQTGAVKKLQNAANTAARQVIEKGTVEAAAAAVTKLAQSLTGDSISAGDLFGGISGVARNPNVEVLFQNMELRTFDLSFKLSPFDDQDALRIEAIIKIFKQAMLPQYKLGKDTKVFGQDNKTLEAGFIQVPKVCAVNFMRGSSRNRFLPRYKMCAITDVNVNYTPDNVYATIDRNMPVATELKLSFMETKLVFSEDVKERGF